VARFPGIDYVFLDPTSNPGVRTAPRQDAGDGGARR
jgi:hypothetical protein